MTSMRVIDFVDVDLRPENSWRVMLDEETDNVPVSIDGKLIYKHACIDGPEIDSHIIEWDKFIPRFCSNSKCVNL